MYFLAIESSCDETSVSIVKDGRTVLSNIISSQIDEHKLYGGVVPEIASRRHTENISSVCQMALDEANLTMNDIDAIGATYAPGLIGALLVGLNFAKGLCLRYNIPFVPVHHIKGHIASNYLSHQNLKPPFICLVVSGGHSHIVEVLSYTKFKVHGKTVDDAAGEAFDKVARALKFPYPGGVYIDKYSTEGDCNKYNFPTPKLANPFDFSFSGLKTSALNIINNSTQKGETFDPNDIAASFQNRLCGILVNNTIQLAKSLNYSTICIAGGVSANRHLRKLMGEECLKNNFDLYLPELGLCGDNGAMIACQGYYEFLDGNTAPLNMNGVASMSIENC